MAERKYDSKMKTTDALRVPQNAAEQAARVPCEQSNYESLERRSRELEDERAHGGPGTAQPPEAATPLLFPKADAPGREAHKRDSDNPPEHAPTISPPACGPGEM